MKDGSMKKGGDLVMVDFAVNDSRSFKANYLGRGNGNHTLYERLFAKFGGDLDAAAENFGPEAYKAYLAKVAAAKDAADKADAPKMSFGAKVLLLVRLVYVPAVGMGLGVMVYQVFRDVFG